jgi:hypothetical protein
MSNPPVSMRTIFPRDTSTRPWTHEPGGVMRFVLRSQSDRDRAVPQSLATDQTRKSSRYFIKNKVQLSWATSNWISPTVGFGLILLRSDGSCYSRPRHRGLTDAFPAGVAELVDALDLGSSDESCGGSSPSARTTTTPLGSRAVVCAIGASSACAAQQWCRITFTSPVSF